MVGCIRSCLHHNTVKFLIIQSYLEKNKPLLHSRNLHSVYKTQRGHAFRIVLKGCNVLSPVPWGHAKPLLATISNAE